MPQPTIQQVHINRPLTMLSIAYLQDTGANFVYDQVFPKLLVDKQSDLYFKYQKDSFFRSDVGLRAPGTESAGTGFGLTTGSYQAEVYSVHVDVPDQVAANADQPLNPMRDATELVTMQMQINFEQLWMSTYFKTGVWGTDVVGGTNFTKWSDESGSSPIEDIRTGIQTVQSNTGFKPNTLTLGTPVFYALLNHPDIVDRIKYGASPSSPAVVSAQAMAQVFGLDRVLIAGGVQANANENNPTQTYGFIAGSNALLSYSPPSPGIMRPSAGYSFYWRGVSEGLGTPFAVRDFYMQWLKVTRVEAEAALAFSLVGSDLGYFLSAAA